MNEIRFIELFAGIGGFRYGLEQANQSSQSTTEKCRSAEFGLQQRGERSLNERGRDELSGGYGEYASDRGFRCVWANEWDKYAASIYRYNYGEIHEGNIETVDVDAIPEHDLCTFGWPCQDNSIAGKRAGQKGGTRSGLLDEAIRILGAKTPKYFLAENVLGLFSVNGGYDFYETIRKFAEVGYDCQWQVLNTRWFLPQNRERIFFVGHLRGTSRPEVFPIGETDGIYPETNIANAIDAKYAKGWLDHGQRTMIRNRSDQDYQDGEIAPPLRNRDKQEVRIIAPAVRSEHHNTSDVHFVEGRVPLKFLNRNQRHYEGDYAFALDGMETNGVQVNGGIRRLTPKECERLQGFPDQWTKTGLGPTGIEVSISDSRRYKGIGNAVSTPVVAAIADKLLT